MASRLERLGGFIKDKAVAGARNVVDGAKASITDANPALFGGIQSGIDALRDEFKLGNQNDTKQAREEQAQNKRQRGFAEEAANEKRYADLQAQKIFQDMDDKLKKILEALVGKDDDSLWDGLPLFLTGLGFKGPGRLLDSIKGKKPPKVSDVDGKKPPKVSDVDGKKPPRAPDVDGKKPPKIVDPELKKIRLRGLGFFDDIVKSFEKMKTSLFKTSIKFPELERYATSMADDMGKSVKAIGDMSDSIKASRESLLAKFGSQFGKGGKTLSGAALDSRLGKLARTADAGAAAQDMAKLATGGDFVKGLSFGMPAEFAQQNMTKGADATSDVAKGADATFDVAKGADATFDVAKGAKGADAAGDASKFKKILNMDVGKLFGEMNGKFMKLLEGPLKFIAALTDVGPLIKGIGKVAGPLGVLIGIYDGLMLAFDTEQLQETLDKTDITIGDRFAGFIGGFIGSIGGLFDLLLGILGIQYEGESVQDFLSNGITKLASFSFEAIGDYFKLVGAYFEGIYGLVTGDQERIQNSKDKFDYLGEKWFGWTDDFSRIVGGMIANSIENIKLSLNIMKESIVGIFDSLMLDISIVGDKLAKRGNEIWNGGRVLIARAVNGIVDGVRSILNWIIGAMNNISNSIIDAVPDSIFGVSLRQQKASAKQALKINRLEKTSDVIDEEAIQKEHREQQAALDASIAAKKGAKEALATKTLANIEQLETVSAETKLQMASANNAAQAERDAEAAARQEELGIKTGFIDDPALAETSAGSGANTADFSDSSSGTPVDPVKAQQEAAASATAAAVASKSIFDDSTGTVGSQLESIATDVRKIYNLMLECVCGRAVDQIPYEDPSLGTPEEIAALEQQRLEESTPVEPGKEPVSKDDTAIQTEELVDGIDKTSVAVIDGSDNIAENAHLLSLEEQAQADAQHRASMESNQFSQALQGELNGQLNKFMSGQSDLVQKLFNALGGSGGSGGGGIFDKIGSLFGGDKEGGLFSKIGTAIGGFFGKGEGGWFDKASGVFGEVGDIFGEVKGFFSDAVGGGTDLAGTFGGSFQGNFTGSSMGDALGGLLSKELDFEGNANSAVYALAQDLAAPGGGFSNFSDTLNNPSFAGGLNAISAIWNGAPVTNARGAIGAGLNIYSMIKGGGAGGIIGNGIANLGTRMVAAQAAKSASFAALSQAGYGNVALAEAAKTGVMGQAGAMLGNFGAGMSAGASTGFNLTGGLGQSTMSGTMGAAAGAIGNGMMTYAIANMLSGGYEINKHLNKIAGAVGSFFGPVGSAVVGVVMGGLNRLFGRKAKKVTETGLDIELGTDTKGQQYSEWIKKGGKYRSDKKGTDYSDMDQGLVDFFNDTAGQLQMGIGSLAGVLGMNEDAVTGFTKAYKISLKDLSPEEQQKKIQEAMKTYANDMIKETYGRVSQYAIEGEDAMATFGRLASATQSVEYWFDALGYAAEETANMFGLAADKFAATDVGGGAGMLGMADWANSPYYKQMMMSVMGGPAGGQGGQGYQEYEDYGGNRNAGRGGYYGGMFNINIDWSQMPQPELTEEQKANQESLALAGAKSAFVEDLGGEEQFGKTMQSYFQNFYTPEEQAEFMAKQATAAAEQAILDIQEGIDALGLDADLADSLKGIDSQEDIDEAKAAYREAIEAAMEAGDMDLAAELFNSADVFLTAANMQLQAAEMNKALSDEDVIDSLSDWSSLGDLAVDTGQAMTGGDSVSNLGSDYIEPAGSTTGDQLMGDGLDGGAGSSSSNVVATNNNVVTNAPNVNNSQNTSVINAGGSSVRDYHPILSIDVRGTTSGYLGLGSR